MAPGCFLVPTFFPFVESAPLEVTLQSLPGLNTSETNDWICSSCSRMMELGRLPICRPILFPGEAPMLMTIGIVLLVLWGLGLFAFHVSTSLIHVLVVLAIIAIVMHLVRGHRLAA